MKKILLTIICVVSLGWTFEGGWDPGQVPADRISTDITSFDGHLSSSDTDVQKALETLDELTTYTDADAQSATGWIKNGSNVYLHTITDYVGIGTDDPQYKIDINGILRSSSLYADDNIGIGTYYPEADLHISRPSPAEQIINSYGTGIGGINEYTKMLFQMENATGTTLPGGTPTLTLYNGATFSSAQSKFGTNSIYFSDNLRYANDYIKFNRNSTEDTNFGTGDFSIDFWYYPRSSNAPPDYAQRCLLNWRVGNYPTSMTQYAYLYLLSTGNGNPIDLIRFAYSNPTILMDIRAPISLTANEWVHLKIARKDGVIKIFKNGTSLELSSSTGQDVSLPLTWEMNAGARLYGGDPYTNYSYAGLYGYLSELRVQKGDSDGFDDFIPKNAPYDTGNPIASSWLKFQSTDADSWTMGFDGEDSNNFKLINQSDVEIVEISHAGKVNIDGDISVSGSGEFIDDIITPAIANLTDNGFIKTSGSNGTLGIDTNTYLTAETDTLATVTARGATTFENIGIGTSAPNSQLEIGGSFASKTTIVSGNTTLDATHHRIIVTNTATITLPTAVGIAGREYNIINGLVGIGTVTIATTSGQTIRGDASLEMYDRGSVVVISDGANWERGS